MKETRLRDVFACPTIGLFCVHEQDLESFIKMAIIALVTFTGNCNAAISLSGDHCVATPLASSLAATM